MIRDTLSEGEREIVDRVVRTAVQQAAMLDLLGDLPKITREDPLSGIDAMWYRRCDNTLILCVAKHGRKRPV